MRSPLRHARLREAMHWDAAEPIEWREILIGALGMAVPAVIGLVFHRPDIGFTIGLGAMLLAGGPAPREPGVVAPSSGSALLPGVLAVLSATAVARQEWRDLALLALTVVAAAISGYSRPVGVAAIRFIVYFVLSLSLLESAGAQRNHAALIFGLGALWNVAIRILLSRRRDDSNDSNDGPAVRVVTAAQRRAHFRRTMRDLSGWQFSLRMLAGLALAVALQRTWPEHHYSWIVITVALLTQRPLEHVPVKTVQRIAGTVVGVGITALIVFGVTSHAVLAVLVCLLAAAVPVVRARSYLAYSALATPVILIVLDLGKPIEPALLTDRVVATLLAGAIVVALNVSADRWLPKPPAPAPRRTA